MVVHIPDETIMQHIKEGKIAEMSVLFERYHLKIYNFFFRLTFNRDISQDLTQNLFYRMIKYRNSYNNEHNVKSWIFQIARNLHADFRNQEKRNCEIILKFNSYSDEVSDKEDSYSEEDYIRLEQAMSNLTPDQKEMIILSRYQGMKYEEISEIMNQSVPAIKVAIHRAIKKLKRIYLNKL